MAERKKVPSVKKAQTTKEVATAQLTAEEVTAAAQKKKKNDKPPTPFEKVKEVFTSNIWDVQKASANEIDINCSHEKFPTALVMAENVEGSVRIDTFNHGTHKGVRLVF
jgi:hypothetical protein